MDVTAGSAFRNHRVSSLTLLRRIRNEIVRAVNHSSTVSKLPRTFCTDVCDVTPDVQHVNSDHPDITLVSRHAYGGLIMSERHGYKTLAAALLFAASGFALAYADTSSSNNGKLSDSDSTFLQQTAQNGLAVTQLGQMALSKSSDPKVKQLAQQLIDNQNKTNDQLKSLAQAKQVTLPTNMTSDVQKQNKQLQGKSGSAFDEAWSKAIVSDHQKTVKTFTQEGKDAKDADVKKFAHDTLPGINDQLKSAQAIAAVPAARDDAMSTAMKASTSSPMEAMPAQMPSAANETPAEAGAAADIKH
jgi:putative membrane protein